MTLYIIFILLFPFLKNIDVGKTNFNTRLLCIKREIVDTRIQAMMEGRINRMKEPFSIRLKQFYDVSSARAVMHYFHIFCFF